MATLAGMPTSRLARPVVLLLAYGMERPLSSRPVATAGLSLAAVERTNFIPLRQRVMRRMLWAGAGLSAAVLAVIVLLIS